MQLLAESTDHVAASESAPLCRYVAGGQGVRALSAMVKRIIVLRAIDLEWVAWGFSSGLSWSDACPEHVVELRNAQGRTLDRRAARVPLGSTTLVTYSARCPKRFDISVWPLGRFSSFQMLQ